WPEEQIQVDFAQGGFHLPAIEFGLPEVPHLARRVFPKQTSRAPRPQRNRKWNRDVETLQTGINRRGVAQHVDVPEDAAQPAFVKGTGGFPQTKQRFSLGQLERNLTLLSGETGGHWNGRKSVVSQ